jgi:hypothetical protein
MIKPNYSIHLMQHSFAKLVDLIPGENDTPLVVILGPSCANNHRCYWNKKHAKTVEKDLLS